MNTLFSEQATTVLDVAVIDQLKTLATQHPQRCARFCLHQDTAAGVQQMLVVLHRSSRFMPHRHPVGKSESVHLISGELGVALFADDGQITQRIHLSANRQFLLRLSGHTWHLPVALTEWAVFHEVYQGPYVKELDVEPLPYYKPAAALERLYAEMATFFHESIV